jgi:hypothetical protein
MLKKIGILIVVMLVLTTIPIARTAAPTDKTIIDDKSTAENNTKWYFGCYVEIEGTTYSGNRHLFIPHLFNKNITFCLIWEHRFVDNGTVSIYRKEGGTLLHEQVDVREFHMISFLGSYSYSGHPLILKGKVIAIQVYDHWTSPS